jgi:hypothetical protein
MSLRNIDHQIAIELGQLDTEYVTSLKDERDQLRNELDDIPLANTVKSKKRIIYIRGRLARIEELLAK